MAMSSGRMKRIIGPTRPVFGSPAASTPKPPIPPTGNGPFSMKSAVMKPQAMNAAMFGMIMPDRKVPNFCTATLAPELPVGAVVVALTGFLPVGTDEHRLARVPLDLPGRAGHHRRRSPSPERG